MVLLNQQLLLPLMLLQEPLVLLLVMVLCERGETGGKMGSREREREGGGERKSAWSERNNQIPAPQTISP